MTDKIKEIIKTSKQKLKLVLVENILEYKNKQEMKHFWISQQILRFNCAFKNATNDTIDFGNNVEMKKYYENAIVKWSKWVDILIKFTKDDMDSLTVRVQ